MRSGFVFALRESPAISTENLSIVMCRRKTLERIYKDDVRDLWGRPDSSTTIVLAWSLQSSLPVSMTLKPLDCVCAGIVKMWLYKATLAM
jgi:hypothetical protein